MSLQTVEAYLMNILFPPSTHVFVGIYGQDFFEQPNRRAGSVFLKD